MDNSLGFNPLSALLPFQSRTTTTTGKESRANKEASGPNGPGIQEKGTASLDSPSLHCPTTFENLPFPAYRHPTLQSICICPSQKHQNPLQRLLIPRTLLLFTDTVTQSCRKVGSSTFTPKHMVKSSSTGTTGPSVKLPYSPGI